jgi:2-polyprenyl-3-methyl-5-hydroxy-6-metoxy-1,4-benzoquinol methylase
MKEFNACSFCGSSTRIYNNSSYFLKCTGCGLIFRYQSEVESSLEGHYQESWKSPAKNMLETGGTDLQLGKMYTLHLLKDLGLKNLNGLRILDFGSGRGSFASALTDLGAEMHLVEPFGYDYLVSKGYMVYRNISDINSEIMFDGIVSIDVLEHLERPWEELAKLSLKLKHKAWFYLTTPNSGSLNSILRKRKWRELKNKSHLVMMNSQNFERILLKTGFTQFKRLRWSINYGRFFIRQWLILILQHLSLDGELRYLAWKNK